MRIGSVCTTGDSGVADSGMWFEALDVATSEWNILVSRKDNTNILVRAVVLSPKER